MRRVYRRKRPLQYLVPFLIFVGIGVIAVLGFQLWNNLQGAKGDVYFYIADGKAKMLQYGLTEWETAYSGTKLSVGDSVKTSPDSRGVLQFFNGTLVRLDADTELTVTDITKRSDVEKIGITLNHGNMWVNKVQSEGVDESDLAIRTTHLQISDVGTTFEVESNTNETVRVMKGAVNVQVLGTDASNKSTVLDTVQVGVGQEMTLDQAVLQAFQNHDTPSVLMALSDQFKLSDWFSWNSQEDQNPTDFSKNFGMSNVGGTQETVSLTVGGTQQVGSTQNVDSTTGSTQQTTTTGSLQTPVITQPNTASASTDQNKMTISGTVGPGTTKIVVHETIGGATDDYTLGKFKGGSTSFSYNVSEALGNFKAGTNDYSFYAVDANGNRSDAAEVSITYNKTPTTVTGTLTAPQVTSYNGATGSAASTVKTGVVNVQGSVAGAASVVVNGYKLSKFQPGDTTWTYYANEGGGNLNPGLNTYEAYAVDPSGNKSAVTTFTITYNKPAGSTTTTGSTQTSTGSGSTGSTQQKPPVTPTPTPSPVVPPSGF